MTQRDEIVTIDGIVEASRAPYVNAAIELADGRIPFEHRENFVVVTSDGRRVTIELAKNPVVEPMRVAQGTWLELSRHPTQPPPNDFPDDRNLRLRGAWILEGEPIRVIGYAKQHDFVPDTGGQREAPERHVSLVRAFAIGVGDNAAEAAQQASARRDREIEERARPRPRPNHTSYAWLVIGAFVLLVVLLIVRC